MSKFERFKKNAMRFVDAMADGYARAQDPFMSMAMYH